MSEELTYRNKRLNELDEILDLTHSYGDDYPVIINRGLDEIINNEIQLNQLKERINKAVENIEQLGHSEWVTFGRSILLYLLKGDKK